MSITRTFLQESALYSDHKIDTTGWYYSVIGEGIRCFWDGGISRDKIASTIPWANVSQADFGSLMSTSPIKKATGLWSSTGFPIYAPDSFLNQLPSMGLDGELLMEGLTAKEIELIQCGKRSLEEKNAVRFAVDTCPPLEVVFMTGFIDITGFTKKLEQKFISNWLGKSSSKLGDFYLIPKLSNFDARLATLAGLIGEAGSDVYLRRHTKLPLDKLSSLKKLSILVKEHESLAPIRLVLTDPRSLWYPKVVSSLLHF